MQSGFLGENLVVRRCGGRRIFLQTKTMPPNGVETSILIDVVDHIIDGCAVGPGQCVVVRVDFGWKFLVKETLFSEAQRGPVGHGDGSRKALVFHRDVTLDDVALAGVPIVMRAPTIGRRVDISAIALASSAVRAYDDSTIDGDLSVFEDEVPGRVFLGGHVWDVLQLGLLQRVERETRVNDGHLGPKKVRLDAGLDKCVYATNMNWSTEGDKALVTLLIVKILLKHHEDSASSIGDVGKTKHPTIRHRLVLLSACLFASLSSFRECLVERRDRRLVGRRHCNAHQHPNTEFVLLRCVLISDQ